MKACKEACILWSNKDARRYQRDSCFIMEMFLFLCLVSPLYWHNWVVFPPSFLSRQVRNISMEDDNSHCQFTTHTQVSHPSTMSYNSILHLQLTPLEKLSSSFTARLMAIKPFWGHSWKKLQHRLKFFRFPSVSDKEQNWQCFHFTIIAMLLEPNIASR